VDLVVGNSQQIINGRSDISIFYERVTSSSRRIPRQFHHYGNVGTGFPGISIHVAMIRCPNYQKLVVQIIQNLQLFSDVLIDKFDIGKIPGSGMTGRQSAWISGTSRTRHGDVFVLKIPARIIDEPIQLSKMRFGSIRKMFVQ
jgi:hypothetical protein